MKKILLFVPALYIGAYMLFCAGAGLQAGFTQDDLMNMYRAMETPYQEVLRDCVTFWRHSLTYRPLGTLVYKVSLDVAGLNLFPLNVVRYLTLGLNLFLVYALTRRLSGSREAGALAALVFSYHQAFSPLYFNTGTLYDLFAFPLYFWALLIYIRARQAGRHPGVAEVAAIAALFILALDMKEMAITLPALVACYELLYHRPARLEWRAAARWMGAACVVPAVTGAIALGFYFGRVLAKDGIASVGGYKVVYSVAEYLKQVGHYLAESCNRPDTAFSASTTLGFFAALLAAALLLRSRALGFAILLFAVGILPVAFIPWRGLNAVYIPLEGLAAFLGVFLVSVRDKLAALADKRSGRPATQGVTLERTVLFALAAVAMIVIHPGLGSQIDAWRRMEYEPIGSFMTQLRPLHPEVKSTERVLVVKDPFGEFNWASLFITRLVYRAPALAVDRLESMDPRPTAEQIAKYDYRLAYEEGKLRDVPAAEVPLGR